jgi:DNA mismatch endonuclease (patch repair protein)
MVMTDKVPENVRSKMMSAVRGKNTGPELAVRTALFAAGYRYRLHRKDLPGSPDVVLSRYRLAVFVHGCFWHGHDCRRGRRPTSNTSFWNNKLDRNRARDADNRAGLEAAGWSVLIVWECAIQQGIQTLLQTLGKKAQAQRVLKITELAR